MPYKGLPPKPEDERINRVPKRFDKTLIETDSEVVVRGPDLPELAPNGQPWTDRTQAFWHVWRTSPQAKLMGPTDWEFMLETAVMHNEFWSPPYQLPNGQWKSPVASSVRANYAAEIRQRVAKFGATWEDRQKLQLMIETPQGEAEAEKRLEEDAKNAVDYVTRLTKKAAEAQEAKAKEKS